jgi:hypothetical protein
MEHEVRIKDKERVLVYRRVGKGRENVRVMDPLLLSENIVTLSPSLIVPPKCVFEISGMNI